MKRLRTMLAVALSLGTALMPWSPATATTVLSFPFDELVANASLIFQGRVRDVRAEEIDGMVYTFVRFDVKEVLKGDYRDRNLELRFLGGEAGGHGVRVIGQSVPRRGEKGFYFVDRLDDNAVNPLLGWSQGHFLIEDDEQGREIVLGSADRGKKPDIARIKGSPLAEKMSATKFSRAAIEEKLEQAAPARVSPAYFRETIRLMTQDPAQ